MRSQKRVTIGRFPEINVEQARVIASDIAADYAKGIDVQEERQSKGAELTLGDLWDDYRENRARRIPGTYSPVLDHQWERYFKKWESKKLSEISYNKARRMILAIRKKAPFHANRIQRHGQAMFNHAKRELRWSGENPFEFALVSEKGRARKVRLEAKDMPPFMKGLDACSGSMKLLFLSSLYTGRRMGEVQAMRWVDVDLETGIWNLPTTKSGESQTAILPRALNKLLAKRQRNAKSLWVFPSPSKSGHVEEIKKAWAQVRDASGLHHLQARDLRRTLASWAQDVNVPIAAVQAQLGHADYSTTAKHYTVISQTVQRVALDETVKSMIEAAGSIREH
jgi:integrase